MALTARTPGVCLTGTWSGISCVWMTKEQTLELYRHIMPEFVTVRTDTIQWIDGVVTKRMYSNAAPATLGEEYTDGTKIYQDIQFPLVEK